MDSRNTINLKLIIIGSYSLYSCLLFHKQEAEFFSLNEITFEV